MSQLSIQYDGVLRIQRIVEKFGRTLERPTGLTKILAARVEEQTKERIKDEKRASDGTSWPAWSPSYAKTRSASNSLLMSDGNLYNSIVGKAVNASSFVVGSPLPYAATHQFGDTSRGIPQREYIGLSSANQNELIQDTGEWLDRQLGGQL